MGCTCRRLLHLLLVAATITACLADPISAGTRRAGSKRPTRRRARHRVHVELHTRGTSALDRVEQPWSTARAQEASPPYHSFPAIVLSMPRSSERRQAMQQRLDKAGAQYTFLDAIDSQQQQEGQMRGVWAGLPFQPPQPYNLSVPDTCRMTTVAQMSCVLSHLLAIFSAYQAGQAEVLILEDDMEVLRLPKRGLTATAPSDWGALQLYSFGEKADEVYSQQTGLWTPWSIGLYSTGAYLLSRAGMQRVLEAYLPGALASGSLKEARLDFSSVHGSDCVADFAIFDAAGTFTSRDFFFVEEGIPSNVMAGQREFHLRTKRLVLKLVSERGYKAEYSDT